MRAITWAEGIDETGRPIFVEAGRPGDPADAADGAKGDVVWSAPSFLGGKNWQPMAFSQRTGLFYVPSNEWGMDIWNEPITYKKCAAYLGAGLTIKPQFEDFIGSLKAVDPVTCEWKWEYLNPAPLWGSVMTTAGGLVFFCTPEGEFVALTTKPAKAQVLPDRVGDRRPAHHLETGWRTVCLGHLGLGRGRPALGWRGRVKGQLPQPGRPAVDLPPTQGTCLGKLTADCPKILTCAPGSSGGVCVITCV